MLTVPSHLGSICECIFIIVSLVSLHLYDRYLAAGSITILWSLVVLAILPETPATAHRLFNQEERDILVARMKGNLYGADNRRVKWYQVREAFCDFKIWLLAAMGAAVYVTNGGVTAFGTLIIKVSVTSLLKCYTA